MGALGAAAGNTLLAASPSDWLEEDTLGVSGASCFRGLHRPPAAPQCPDCCWVPGSDPHITSQDR